MSRTLRFMGWKNWACSFLLCHLFFSPQTLWADDPLIKLLTEKSKAIVVIRSEIAGVLGSKPQPIAIPEKNTVALHQSIIPFRQASQGAGVFIHPSGVIVTNAHLLIQGAPINVMLFDKSIRQGTLVGLMPDEDLALIKIVPPFPLPYLQLANSDKVKVRDKVYTIGSSVYSKNTLSEGIISGYAVKGQKGKPASKTQFIEITFNLYHGDSGSPLLDKQGRLLGIMSGAAVNQNKRAYAVPSSNILKGFQPQLEKLETVLTSPKKE